jgi:hypothetical protein
LELRGEQLIELRPAAERVGKRNRSHG